MSSPNIDLFKNSFTGTLSKKFAIKSSLKIPPNRMMTHNVDCRTEMDQGFLNGVGGGSYGECTVHL